MNLMSDTSDVEQINSAKSLLQTILQYKDATEKIETCKKIIERINDGKYQKACELLANAKSIMDCDEAKTILYDISPYKNSKELIEKADERKKTIQREINEKAEKKEKKNVLIFVTLLSVCIIAGIIYVTVIKPSNMRSQYDSGIKAIADRDFETAYRIFLKLKDYENSEVIIDNIKKEAYVDAQEAEKKTLSGKATILYLISAGYEDGIEKCISIVPKLSQEEIHKLFELAVEFDGYYSDKYSNIRDLWKKLLPNYLKGKWYTKKHTYKYYENKTKSNDYIWTISENNNNIVLSAGNWTERKCLNNDMITSIYVDSLELNRVNDYLIKGEVKPGEYGTISKDFTGKIMMEINTKDNTVLVSGHENIYWSFDLEIYRTR